MSKVISAFLLPALLLASHCDSHAEIPDWYEEAIPRLIANADSIVLYKVASISLVREFEHHYVYKLDSFTVEVLKGSASAKSCYYRDVEGPWDFAKSIGELRLAILADPEPEAGSCRLIDVGHGAPGTAEYVRLFNEAMIEESKNAS